MPTLGKFIQRRRVELGLTQEQLAELVGGGVRQAEISRLEHDRVTLPRRQRLEQIARALDVPLGELLARSGWTGAEVIDAGLDGRDEAERLQDHKDELEVRAAQLESTVTILATTNVDLHSKVAQLESHARHKEQEESFYRSVLDGVTDPVAVVDSDGQVVAENAAFVDLREGHAGLTQITTVEGEPIVGALSAFRSTDLAEERTTTIVVNGVDRRSWHEVHVRPVTLDSGSRISVITVKECAEPA